VVAAADQRNLNTKAFIADMATELENYRRENVTKLSQAHDALKEVGQVCEKTVFLGDEEGAIQDV
jgi:hypothetical protein